jgi:ligand-binding SRPBCC domain-containing protein
MPTIDVAVSVAAPIERVFDLARSIDFHVVSADGTGERAIAGRTAGLIELGETVTWSARHFGVRQRLTVRITEFDRPRRFRDSMVDGAFRSFDHDHLFEVQSGATLMRDVFRFETPLGVFGRIASALVVERHMRRFLVRRGLAIKAAAESDAWKRFVG